MEKYGLWRKLAFWSRITVFIVILAAGMCVAPEERPAPPTWQEINAKRAPAAKGWKYIVIHHSGSTRGNAATFHKWHVAKGYGGLAYHFVIGNGKGARDGEVEVGFRWREQLAGTHVSVNSWHHNIFGIGICLVGDFSRTIPTKKQLAALVRLIDKLRAAHGIPARSVMGHKDVPFSNIDWNSRDLSVTFDFSQFQKQDCPGRRFPWRDLKEQIGQYNRVRKVE